MLRTITIVVVAVLFAGGGLCLGGDVLKSTTTGNPELQSINVISFAPEGVLLVGDGRGAQIFAIATGDTRQQATLSKTIDFWTDSQACLITSGKSILLILSYSFGN